MRELCTRRQSTNRLLQRLDDTFFMLKIEFADTVAFAAWYRSLSLTARLAIDSTLLFVSSLEDTRQTPNKLYKVLFAGIAELRIGKNLGEALRIAKVSLPSTTCKRDEGVLLRLFCHALTTRHLLILNGYDKAADPRSLRQKFEIQKAIAILESWRLQNDVF